MPILRTFGWLCTLSALATLGTLITGALFFAKGGRWGPINDAVSVAQMVTMLPVAVIFFLWSRGQALAASWVALVLGAGAMLLVGWLQALLALKRVTFESTFATVLSAGAAIGLWLIAANALTRGVPWMPTGMTALGFVAGLGYVLPIISYRLRGQEHPLFVVGSLSGVLCYAAWALWLGLRLVAGV